MSEDDTPTTPRPLWERLDILPGTTLPPALRRLVEEVRDERAAGERGVAPHRYDRIHSRHNRS